MEKQIIITIIFMGLVTYLPRALPGIIFSKINLPQDFLKWLELIPASILSSLIVKEILTFKNHNPTINLPYLLGCILAYFLAKKGVNYIVSLGLGMFLVFLLRIIGS